MLYLHVVSVNVVISFDTSDINWKKELQRLKMFKKNKTEKK